MSESYREYFKVDSDGIKELLYEDISCKASVNVADFRDSIWWITITSVINKKSNEIEKVTKDQELEIYTRISAEIRTHGIAGIYVQHIGVIEGNMNDINYTTSILDM